MRSLQISNTATDLMAAESPFLPGYDVVVFGAAGLIIQGSDTEGFSSPVTLATLTSSGVANVSLDYQYIRVSTAANAALVGF